MEDLLFLAQRIPYPPDKGEKIRSFHILKHLAQRYRVHLGCFIDDPADEQYVPALADYCASYRAVRLRRSALILRGLAAFALNISISEASFRNPKMARWISQACMNYPIHKAFVFCSTMAPYAIGLRGRKILDIVDVDSEKWRAYADTSSWPLSAVYMREARKVLSLERRAAASFDRSLFVSPCEAAAFLRLAPETASRVLSMNNGVDLDYFDPSKSFASPFAPTEMPLVFTGTMNYRPNEEGVLYFAKEILPKIQEHEPRATFWIVGARPSTAVKSLAGGARVRVTGSVPDVRPYLAHASCVVAPLRIARGVQNKILEGFAMARPVVASPQACEGINAADGQELLIAREPEEFARAVRAIFSGKYPNLGYNARQRVTADYRWSKNLQILDELFSSEHLPL